MFTWSRIRTEFRGGDDAAVEGTAVTTSIPATLTFVVAVNVSVWALSNPLLLVRAAPVVVVVVIDTR